MRHKDFLSFDEWRDVHVIRISYLLANNLNVRVIRISYLLANNLNVCVIRISYPLVNDANVRVIRIFVFYDTISYPMTRRRIFFSCKKTEKKYIQRFSFARMLPLLRIIILNTCTIIFCVSLYFLNRTFDHCANTYIYTHIRENIDKSKDFQIRDGFVDIGCKSC